MLSGLILWPRQEVFQLIIPQLGSRNLTFCATSNIIQKLSKVQSTEGKISFDRWLVAAKDTLKWNDFCIQLFWEMLTLATSYIRNEGEPEQTDDDTGIDLETVAIFLVLHMADTHMRPSSPIVAYDTVWPSVTSEGELSPASPNNSPTTGEKKKHAANSSRIGSPVTSPRSPGSTRSPRRKGSASSPSKRSSSHLSHPRSSAQYLHAARHKTPIILKALCSDPDIDFSLDPSLNRSDSLHRSHDAYDRYGHGRSIERSLERSNSGM